MQMKIYLLYTFSVEYLSRLTLNHKIIKLCGAFCWIYYANVSNLILIIRPTALWQFGTSAFNMVVYWHELGEVENECTRLFAIFVPKIVRFGGSLT